MDCDRYGWVLQPSLCGNIFNKREKTPRRREWGYNQTRAAMVLHGKGGKPTKRPQPMESPMLSSCSLRGAVLLVTQTAEIPLILFQFMHFHPEAGRVREWFCGDASWGNQNLIYQSLPLKHLSEDFPSYFKKWSYGIPKAFPLSLKNHYRHVIPQVKTVMTKL